MSGQACEQLTFSLGDSPASPSPWLGSRRERGDDRYLWPEMLRVIRELRPRCVVGENVPGIIRIAAGQVVKDLERAGYHVVVFNFEAAAVGAWHRRSRVFFVGIADVADTDDSRLHDSIRKENQFDCGRENDICKQSGGEWRLIQSAGARACADERLVDNALRGGRAGIARRKQSQELADGRCWAAEPDVGRVANGVPHRVDRLKCLGNAVVPQQAYPIFKALMEELNRWT